MLTSFATWQHSINYRGPSTDPTLCLIPDHTLCVLARLLQTSCQQSVLLHDNLTSLIMCYEPNTPIYENIYILTRKLQEVRFMTEDQVVVGNEVEEPDIQLFCIVALRINRNIQCVKKVCLRLLDY